MTDKPASDSSPIKKDNSSRSDWTKILAAFALAIVPVAAGLIQFSHTYAFSLRQPFLSKQTEMCIAAAENAARLATSKSLDRWMKAREEFWMLYHGPLAIVEDVGDSETNRVSDAMQMFGHKLEGIEEKTPLRLPLGEWLEDEALSISHACSKLLVLSWEFGLFGWLGRGRQSEEDPTDLTEEARKAFYRVIELKPKEPGKFYDPIDGESVSQAAWQVSIGAEAPSDVDEKKVPPHYELESIWRFHYTVVNDKVVLIEPGSRKAVRIVPPPEAVRIAPPPTKTKR